MATHRRKATETRKAQPEYDLMLMNTGFSGKIITSREGVTSTNSALTKLTLVEVNMAKESLPNFHSNYNYADCLGLTFHRWTVLSLDESSISRWICQCACGLVKSVDKYAVTRGVSKSCGCLRSEITKQLHTKHGLTGSPEYRTWSGMLRRCYNRNDKSYSEYGGRGVAVCDRWRRSFENFFADMGSKPPGTSIDRIDGTKGYSPDNCRWATAIEQSNNRSINRILTWNGQSHTTSEWAVIVGLKPSTLTARLNVLKWTVEKALSTPLRGK